MFGALYLLTAEVYSILQLVLLHLRCASAAGEHARSVAQAHIEELSSLTLKPISYSFSDPNRHRIDAVALDMLGLADGEIMRSLDRLRNIWCREPSVHGGNKRIMKALGIE